MLSPNLIQIFLLLLFLGISNFSFGQTLLSGTILDESKNPISNVSVSYKKTNGTSISGFTKSLENGKFKLEIKLIDTDSIELDFNHISFRRKSIRILNRTANYSITLQSETRKIEEVRMPNLSIHRKKDTLKYRVDAFKTQQDRVIADIIKRLPGVEIKDDVIYYQGKEIKKYMVDNLDLMGSSYALINKNLSADVVKSIQVVENDQPIKILDSIFFSNQASINLELKKFVSTGSANLGIGLSPILWDVNLTAMTFAKNFQMLHTFQTNNSGNDVTKSLKSLYSNEDLNLEEGRSFIGLQNVASPNFDEKKWLDNKVFLIGSNVLFKLKSNLQLKANISYFDDLKKNSGYSATQYFTDNQAIYSSEGIDNNYRSKVIQVSSKIEKNENNIYLRNQFMFHKRKNSDFGNIQFNNRDQIVQKRYYTDYAFLNSFETGYRIGKQMYYFNSSLEYHKTPQSLRILPGQFEDIINHGISYEELQQHISHSNFKWNNRLNFTKIYKRLMITPGIGLNYYQSNLESFVEKISNSEKTILGSDYTNDNLNSVLSFSTQLGIGWNNAKWKIYSVFPYSRLSFNVKQKEELANTNSYRNTFNPAGSLTYLWNSKNQWNLSISSGKEYQSMDNLYSGYIIQMYRNMQRYNARLLFNNNFKTDIHYRYNNPVRAEFANVGYSYSIEDRDYIFSSKLDSLGRESLNIEDVGSKRIDHTIAAGISRIFSSIRTNIKINGNYGWSKSDYLINDHLANRASNHIGASLNLINNYSKIISGDYKISLNRFKNTYSTGTINTIIQNNHFLNLYIYPQELHSLTLSNSLYNNNFQRQKNQYFLDVIYRYQIKKLKTDLEFSIQNILDNDQYIQQFVNEFQFIQSSFQLRPRQFFISTKIMF